MKIGVFGTRGEEKSYLKRKLKKHSLKFFEEPLTLDNVDKAKNFKIISVFVQSKIDKKILSKLPNLELIAVRSTGVDHIDLKTCKKKKICVSNVPSYGENTVAEHAFALILALSRKLWLARQKLERRDFSIDGMQGFDLYGKTIGVVGGGTIGFHVIKIAKAFGMEVIVNDLHPDTDVEDILDIEFVTIKELLKESDIVTLHVPYNKSTHHMINSRALRLMKKEALLINTSRGGVVDTNALIKALEKKKIGGAGLDVIEGEDLLKEEMEMLDAEEKREKLSDLARDEKLFTRDDVIFTPHIAFYSKEAVERILETTIDNIELFVTGREVNKVC